MSGHGRAMAQNPWTGGPGLLVRLRAALRVRGLARRAAVLMARQGDPLPLIELAHLLGHVGGPEATAALCRLLAGGTPSVRMAALEALAALGGSRAADALREAAARDPSVAVRRAAACRLARLGG